MRTIPQGSAEDTEVGQGAAFARPVGFVWPTRSQRRDRSVSGSRNLHWPVSFRPDVVDLLEAALSDQCEAPEGRALNFDVAFPDQSRGRATSEHFALERFKLAPRLTLAFVHEPDGGVGGHRPAD